MYDDNAKCNAVAGRDPVSHEVMNLAGRTADRAEALAKRTQDKLSPVMMPATPVCGNEAKIAERYPPLFEDLRSRLGAMNNALDMIEDALQRTEL